MRKLGLLLLPLLAANGCMTVGPDYEKPELPAIAGATSLELDLQSWWTQFNDPVLTRMVEDALEANKTLAGAVARVNQARAQLGQTKASLGPQLDAAGSVTRQQLSENAGGSGSSTSTYSAGFDAVWEIDIFGGTRRSIDAALADLEAQEIDFETVKVSVAAETAQTYLTLRTYEYRLKVAQANLAAQQDTLDILISRRDAGLSDELDVQQARYNLESTRSTIPTLEAGVQTSRNALAVLIGKMPGDLQIEMTQTIPQSSFAFEGIPADVLRRRPDVASAERDLAAETARVGASVAELYPKFSLTGSIGLESLHSSSLFSSGSEGYSIIPGIDWPIFYSGSIRNAIKVQEAVLEETLATYEETVLTAVQEVKDALVNYEKELQTRDALSAAVDAAAEAEALASDQYKSGLTDFNDVLDAQRSLLGFQEELAISEGTVANNAVSLYKAMGGGWKPME